MTKDEAVMQLQMLSEGNKGLDFKGLFKAAGYNMPVNVQDALTMGYLIGLIASFDLEYEDFDAGKGVLH